MKTKYMGLDLRNPVIVSSSGLTGNPEAISKCEKNGAGAVVLKSLFEEQISAEIESRLEKDSMYFWYPEAREYVKSFSGKYSLEKYLDQLKKAKSSVKIPLIASINCVTHTKWIEFAKEIEQAGADALELNINISPSDQDEPGSIEERYIQIVKEVKKSTGLPVAVKIGFYFTNLLTMVKSLAGEKADSVVMFNRFFRPDIDINEVRPVTGNYYSSPGEITLALRWIALLSGKADCDLVAATGIHDAEGTIKCIMAGATAVQLCTILYRNGLKQIGVILKDMESWMKKKNYGSIADFSGLLANKKEYTPELERIQFMKRNFDMDEL